MATLALYTFESLYVTLDGSNNVLAVADQSVNGYNLAELTSTNGGLWEAAGFGGYPSVLMDGTNDALVQTGGLANAMVGGDDNSNFLMFAQQRVASGTSGDACFTCGNSASANFFYRLVESGAGFTTEGRKRDDATAAGSGAGATGTAWDNTRQVWEWDHPGTTFSLVRTGTNGVRSTYIASTAMDVGTCTTNQFAIGCLYRNTASGFMNERSAFWHILDAAPASGELDALRSIAARYISPPLVIRSAADRARRDRHLHRCHRPTTWKLSKNGVMIPAEDKRIIQVDGFRDISAPLRIAA